MFCMARIVCHLKFEAIALNLRFAYPAPIQGSLCQEFVEDNNIIITTSKLVVCTAPIRGAYWLSP